MSNNYISEISIPSQSIERQRIFGLDLLRSFAIIFVLIDHWRYLLPYPYSSYLKLFALDGVSIFFVLSGFLIGKIIIKDFDKEDIDFKTVLNFWIRRWFRTLPVYYFVLSLAIILNLISTNYNDIFNVNVTNIIFLFKTFLPLIQISILNFGV